MYAVIETGGKQYRVELGSVIRVDRLSAQPGDSITLDRVLLIADGDATAVGQPVVDGATVRAEVLGQERGEKIVVFKYKPKARTRVKKGHRAELTTLRIADIAFGGKSAAKEAQQAESRKDKAAREAEKEAERQAAADRELAARLAASEGEKEGETESPTTRRSARRKPAATEPPDARATATTEAPHTEPTDAQAADTEPTDAAEAAAAMPGMEPVTPPADVADETDPKKDE
jgi:large subunit ribosomal protein L21